MHSSHHVNLAFTLAAGRVPSGYDIEGKSVETLSCLFEVAADGRYGDGIREAAQALGSGLAPLYDAPKALLAAFALPFDKLADIANGKRVLVVPDNAICITH